MGWVQYLLLFLAVNHTRIIFLKENIFLTQTNGNSESISLTEGVRGWCFSVSLSRSAAGFSRGGSRAPQHRHNQNTCTHSQGLRDH